MSQKKPTLHTITRELGTSERFWDELRGPSDRTCAIILSSFIEYKLTLLLLCEMKDDLTKTEVDRLFFQANATLGSFSSRIEMANALGLLVPSAKASLEVIRKLRNAFAHAITDLTFEHPVIAASCSSLDFPPFPSDVELEGISVPRRRFIAVGVCLVNEISGRARVSPHHKRAVELLNPYSRGEL